MGIDRPFSSVPFFSSLRNCVENFKLENRGSFFVFRSFTLENFDYVNFVLTTTLSFSSCYKVNFYFFLN